VGAVWLGNDDNRPMASGTTGGHFAAPVWHSFMSVVHTDMNIPTIPGLEPHPVQVAEQQRIAAMRAEGTAPAAPGDATKASSSLMSDPTREALKHLAESLRKAAGIAEPVEPTPPKLPGTKPPAAPGAAPAKRADGTPPGRSPTLPYDNTVGAIQPAPSGIPHRAVP
jgi:penicillin-binding protein 1A